MDARTPGTGGEAQFAQPESERGRPLVYPDAAGWRVVLETGSPVPPAREAADWFAACGEQQAARWYEALITAWESGGRDGALRYLTEQRDQVLDSLKLRPT